MGEAGGLASRGNAQPNGHLMAGEDHGRRRHPRSIHPPHRHRSTILDVAGLPAPTHVDGIEQKPMDGASIASTFYDAKAKPFRQRQYFEVFTNRAIYDNGWIACAQHTFPWRQDL